MTALPHTVLCVDDEINVLNALKRLFRKEGYTLLTTSSGADALKLLQENPVHMIISDQRMPEMSGTELMAKIKELYPDVIRIILTGYTDVDTITESINKGHIYKFFLKPWNDQALVLEIRQALEQFDLAQTNKILHQKVIEQNETFRQINDNLEALVKERTHEVEIQNQALALSHAILEDLPVPIIGVSTDLMIVLINKAVHEVDAGIQIGRPVADYISEDNEKKIIEVMASGISQTLSGTPLGPCLRNIDVTPLSGRFSGKGVVLTVKGHEAG
ncbi:MAG: response regulator [Deltaproteobacteria bacterium]|nr:response regulator [Deltaproteobacteria bacterium]